MSPKSTTSRNNYPAPNTDGQTETNVISAEVKTFDSRHLTMKPLSYTQ